MNDGYLSPAEALMDRRERSVRSVIEHWSTVVLTIAVMPGVLLKIGTRTLLASVLHLGVDDVRLLPVFGGSLFLRNRPRGRQLLALVLIPVAVALVVGFVFVAQPIIDVALLGVSPVPVVTSDPQAFAHSRFAGVTLLTQLYSSYGRLGLFYLWIGFSAWFCAAPAHAEVELVRRGARQRGGLFGLMVSVSLFPLQVWARVTEFIDKVIGYLAPSVWLATGTLTLVLLFGLGRIVANLLI